MAMPSIEFGGETRGYQRFAEDTFTNALLVIRDGRIVFEDYRNRSDARPGSSASRCRRRSPRCSSASRSSKGRSPRSTIR
jgi:hypothetical protein